jgi:phosphomannomutase
VISDQLRSEVQDWIKNDPDPVTAEQLSKWLSEGNELELNRCFNGFLQFGTAGLRGPISPGPSGMNRAVVSRTATAIASFMKENNLTTVVIGRDARHRSADFAKDSAEIFAGAGIKTYLFSQEIPTPVLAFSVNKLNANVGIMVTASHNPATDNGYKVYLGTSIGNVQYRGSQIISPIDKEISDLIEKVELAPTRSSNYEIVKEEIISDYILATAKLATTANNIKIVYTPLHGVGMKTLVNVFEEAKFSKLILVSEQALPDPNFPTTPFPNPEENGVMDLAIEYAKKHDADLVIANDPDADRCAVAISDESKNWRMLRGDEVGVILGKYLIESGKLTGKSVANSLVSSTLLSKIARKHGIRFEETLTGFKWISKVPDLAYGYEEAIGYCVDPQIVNDKDGISAALLIAQLAGELKMKSSSLNEYMQSIGEEFGFHETDQISIRFSDINKIDILLSKIKDNPPDQLAGLALETIEDLSKAEKMQTTGIRMKYRNNIRVIIRPSGTEPKLKCYIEVICDTKKEAISLISQIKQALTKVLS